MGKPLIITGSSQGIGAATARLAAKAGYDVCVTYRGSREKAEEVASDVREAGRRAHIHQVDVSNPKEVEALFNACDEQLGVPVGLVNNAGILGPSTVLGDLEPEQLRAVFETNVFGAFYCAREAVTRMSPHNGGRGGAIVNLSSVVAKFGAPNEYVHYAATKGAIDVMTKGLATEVAPLGIRVNSVRPGLTDTEMFVINGDSQRIARIAPSIPMQRAGQPQEIAAAILWLLSDEASYVTGAILDVGGGR